jgi:hypothetical protein
MAQAVGAGTRQQRRAQQRVLRTGPAAALPGRHLPLRASNRYEDTPLASPGTPLA